MADRFAKQVSFIHFLNLKIYSWEVNVFMLKMIILFFPIHVYGAGLLNFFWAMPKKEALYAK